MTEEIRTERRAGALWIVVDRPAARNAMTFAMYDRIAAICRDANGDDSIKAVVISGSADAFVAGTDIAQFVNFEEASQALEYERRMDAWLGAIEDVRVPTIAASPRRRRASESRSRERSGTASPPRTSSALLRSSVSVA